MKQAVILAGGKGTRLKDRLNGLPKPLIDICGTPLLERQIMLCKRYGITRLLILVNHAAEQIIHFCVARQNFGIDIQCIDDGESRGTAGAVMAVMDHLDDEFLVIYGDTMLDVDVRRFWDFHQAQSAAVTLFLHPNDHPQDSDLVDTDENGYVTAFYPSPHQAEEFYPNLVNAALYIVQKSALAGQDKSGLRDFGKDLFPAMLRQGKHLRGYNSPEYIKDCGTPERLDKVCEAFRSGRIARSCLDQKQIAVFIDRDGTINPNVGFLSDLAGFELIDGVARGIRRLNGSDYRAVLVTNQPVIARGDTTVAGLHRIHNKMETLLGREGAYLDRIYYCPHHPDGGFPGEVAALKIACACRKPEIGMILQAQQDLNIDLTRSWMIGDTTTDILTARRAGVRSVLVKTGAGGKDGKYDAAPDFTVHDLAAAVDLILDKTKV